MEGRILDNNNFTKSFKFVCLKNKIASTYVEGINSGFGISLLNILETQTRYRFTQANINYAYRVELADGWAFMPSLSIGFGSKDFSFDSLILEDQIDIPNSTTNIDSVDPILLNASTNFFDFSVGGLITNDRFWFGVGARHLNTPNISFEFNQNESLDMFVSIHAGYNYELDNLFYLWNESQLRIFLNFMNQGVYNRFDLGAELETSSGFIIGGILATSPVKYHEESTTINALNIITGFVWDNIKVGYSYDISLSGLKGTNGVHELSISYTFKSVFNSRFGCWRCQR
jgi:type IX secretion system PorP/SprF family membrane protein